jgi:uncharacterized protein
MTLSLLVAAIVIGLMGAGHCAVMCGPTTVALIVRSPSQHRQPWAAHCGRIATYAALGAAAAWFTTETTQLLRQHWLKTAWFLLPNVLLLLSALYLLGFRFAYAPIESFGRRVWSSLGSARNFAAKRRGVTGDLMRGALWGMMPCAMVYSAIGIAVIAVEPWAAAAVMIVFGMSTLPVLLALGWVSSTALVQLQTPQVRQRLGLLLLALALWNVYLIPSRVRGVELPFLC